MINNSVKKSKIIIILVSLLCVGIFLLMPFISILSNSLTAYASSNTSMSDTTALLPRNENLLENGDFKLNSNGKDSYTGIVYGFDNWKGLRYDSVVSSHNNGILIAGTTRDSGICQYVSCPLIYVTDCTFSLSINILELTQPVRLWLRSNTWNSYKNIVISEPGIHSFSVDVPKLTSTLQLVYYLDFSVNTASSYSCVVDWCKLEYGSTATPYYSQNNFDVYKWIPYSINVDMFSSSQLWTDGFNLFHSDGSYQYVFDFDNFTWNIISWNIAGLDSSYIFGDGTNYYCFLGSGFVLNRSTMEWDPISLNVDGYFYGWNFWSDGSDVYYSSGTNHYIFDTTDYTMTPITWNLSNFNGSSIWTDGTNIYYSNFNEQYILDKTTKTWNSISWGGLTEFDSQYIWSDGYSVFYSCGDEQYILDKSSHVWHPITWSKSSSLDLTYVFVFDGYAFCDSYVSSIPYYSFGYDNGYNDGNNAGYNEGYDIGYDTGNNDGYNTGYDDGYESGASDTISDYIGYGAFTYSSIAFYEADSSGLLIDSPLSNLYSGSLTEYTGVDSYNGGFVLDSTEVYDFLAENDTLQIGYRISFDNPISVRTYSSLVPLYFQFGNAVIVNFSNNTSYSFNMADDYFDYIDLTVYSSDYIRSIDVLILNPDVSNIGLAFSADYSIAYDKGYYDGNKEGSTNGYNTGYDTGYYNGYNEGINDSNAYTFTNLIGSVLDAPISAFTSLLNFDILGVNLLAFISGLFTLAIIIFIIKLFLGGK
ncbi:MAG TPA: hypothetical protein IAC46_03685 [Candidatus Onthoplasma faecigallinarum]|nr:hypothetical protein [Candidatus Onthoplasma faecigallinarum]